MLEKNTICWKHYPFSIELSFHLCQKLVVHIRRDRSECGNLNLAALYAFVLDLEGVELATTAEFERLSHHWRFLILILYWLENNSSCTFVTTYIRGLVQVRQKKLLSYWQQNPHEDLVVKLQASWKAMEMIIMELLLCKWLYFWSLSN